MMKIILLGVAAAVVATAQSNVSSADPAYWIGAGASYSHYASPPLAAGWLSAAVKVADKTYWPTTLDLMSTTADMRTGVARVLARSGRWVLLAHANGALTSAGLGGFSSGAMLIYNLGGRWSDYSLMGVIPVVASTPIKPVVEIGIGRSF
jgi:hypothetical protein